MGRVRLGFAAVSYPTLAKTCPEKRLGGMALSPVPHFHVSQETDGNVAPGCRKVSGTSLPACRGRLTRTCRFGASTRHFKILVP